MSAIRSPVFYPGEPSTHPLSSSERRTLVCPLSGSVVCSSVLSPGAPSAHPFSPSERRLLTRSLSASAVRSSVLSPGAPSARLSSVREHCPLASILSERQLLSCLMGACHRNCQNNGRPEMTDWRWRPDMTDQRWRPDMTESPSGGQSSVLCPDGLPLYREILCPHNTVIQSSRLSIHIFQQS